MLLVGMGMMMMEEGGGGDGLVDGDTTRAAVERLLLKGGVGGGGGGGGGGAGGRDVSPPGRLNQNESRTKDAAPSSPVVRHVSAQALSKGKVTRFTPPRGEIVGDRMEVESSLGSDGVERHSEGRKGSGRRDVSYDGHDESGGENLGTYGVDGDRGGGRGVRGGGRG